MRIAVVDDDAEMRRELAGYIDRFSEENAETLEAVQFSSADGLLRGYKPEYDVIIFDIDMPGTNGMDAARAVRTVDQRVAILFITNIAQYAINGYEVDAVDYVIKPIGYYDFSMKLKKALRRASMFPAYQIAVEALEGPTRLDVADVYYIEAAGHYVIFHTKNGSIRARASLKDHESELRAYNFRRTHRSYIINLMHLENVYQTDVIVAGEAVPLGRTHRDVIITDFMRYMRG